MYQWIRLNKLYKLMKSFSIISICFQNFVQKPKNIQKNKQVVNVD